MRLSDSSPPAPLVEADIPQPQPGRDELLVRVHAAGVTSKELLWYPTTHDKNGQPASVADKPGRLTHVEAASVPIGALTAWQGLFERARLRAGEHVLVHGGAGAVGIFAVQLARFHGARVTATASPRNHELVAQRVKDAFFIVAPNHDQLTRIGDLLQTGDLRPVVDVVVSLSQASVAHAGDAPGRLGRGKVIVAIAAWVPDPLVGRQERT